MLLEARFQVCHALLERGDLIECDLELTLLILYHLHERTHHGLNARVCARPVVFGYPQSLRQVVIHIRESASYLNGCQLTWF